MGCVLLTSHGRVLLMNGVCVTVGVMGVTVLLMHGLCVTDAWVVCY